MDFANLPNLALGGRLVELGQDGKRREQKEEGGETQRSRPRSNHDGESKVEWS